jgi:hypothetical protein
MYIEAIHLSYIPNLLHCIISASAVVSSTPSAITATPFLFS